MRTSPSDKQAQLKTIRSEEAECLLWSSIATDEKRELFARRAEYLNSLASEVEKAIAANGAAVAVDQEQAIVANQKQAVAADHEHVVTADHQRSARSQRIVPWLAVVLIVATGAFFWATNRDAEMDTFSVVNSQSAEPSHAPPDDTKQTIGGALLSGEQAERKLLREQLGALASRVDNLERALNNLEKSRAPSAASSNKRSARAEGKAAPAEMKLSTPEEKPVRVEEKRTTTLEKPSAAEENVDAKHAASAASSDRQSIGAEGKPAEMKPSAPEEKLVRVEEKRTPTLEKPSPAEENVDAKQSGTSAPIVDPADRVGAISVPKQAELDSPKPAIGPRGCTRFRSFDPVSGTYMTFGGKRRPCR